MNGLENIEICFVISVAPLNQASFIFCDPNRHHSLYYIVFLGEFASLSNAFNIASKGSSIELWRAV
jgi:hypothetical protein